MGAMRFAYVTIITIFLFAAASAPGRAAETSAGNLENMLGEMSKLSQSPAPETGQKRVPFGRAEMQLSFAPLVKSAAPAVVNVYAARKVRQRSPFADDPFFEQFFGQGAEGPARVQSSLGSGVLVDASGIVVTNNHVIADADELKIALADGREFECAVLLKDERSDLAILKIKANETFPTLTLADSDAIEVGDLVLAIGDPFGVGQTTTSGIISALARNQVGVSDFGFFIQTDAAINPGNSGGALLNMSGEVIGINSAIFSKSGGSVGIGFAIPSNMVRAVLETAEGGKSEFDRPYIGATFEPVTAEIAESLGLGRPAGALVTGLDAGGPAEKAGVKVGDVVLAMDGQEVEHPDALGYRLVTRGIGKIAKLDILTQGVQKSVAITLSAPPKDNPADEQAIGGDGPFSGITVANISPRIAQKLRLGSGKQGVVVIRIADGSPAQRVGFRAGDVILELNGEAVTSVRQFASLAQSDPLFWRFTLNRGGRIMRQMFR